RRCDVQVSSGVASGMTHDTTWSLAYSHPSRRDPHSFPTRRSSDLKKRSCPPPAGTGNPELLKVVNALLTTTGCGGHVERPQRMDIRKKCVNRQLRIFW